MSHKTGQKSKNFNKQKRKIKSYKEELIKCIPKPYRRVWFKSKEDELNFANWLIEQDELYSDILLAEKIPKNYNKKMYKKVKPANNAYDIYINLKKIHKINKKIYKSHNIDVDANLAKILNPKKYSKKYINRDDYRKELKKIAKKEKRDMSDVSKLCNAIKHVASNVKDGHTSLSDEYFQKHPLR